MSEQAEQSTETTRPGRVYEPHVDIWETEDKLWLWADMPGVGQDSSVDVHLDDGNCPVCGRKRVRRGLREPVARLHGVPRR